MFQIIENCTNVQKTGKRSKCKNVDKNCINIKSKMIHEYVQSFPEYKQ